MTERSALGVVVVGAGYWGPNLVRNFHSAEDWRLVAICDRDLARASQLAARYPATAVAASLEEALMLPGVDAVAVASPARTHEPLALLAIDAGKGRKK